MADEVRAVEFVELLPMGKLLEVDPIYRALDAARIALFRCQRGDGDIPFAHIDDLLSKAQDARFAERGRF